MNMDPSNPNENGAPEPARRKGSSVGRTLHTKRLAFRAGLQQCCTDIIRFSHGASSSRKVYRSSFIPGLHDVSMVFDKSE